MRSIIKASLIASVGAATVGLYGCDETNKLTTTQNTKPVISGKAVLAETGEGLASAKVRLRINGKWYETTTTGGDSHKTGDFRFATDIPADASFFIEIDPKEDMYANSYSFGSTQVTDAGVGFNALNSDFSKDVGHVAVFDAVESTITLKDIDTGAVINGIGMWMDTFTTGAALAGQIAFPLLQPTVDDAAPGGMYTWTLPDNNQVANVVVNGLVDASGNVYQTLAGDLLEATNFDGDTQGPAPAGAPTTGTPSPIIGIGDNAGNGTLDTAFTNRTLTSLAPGVDSTIYLRRATRDTATVNIRLYEGENTFETAGMAINVLERSTGQVFAAEQGAEANLYTITGLPFRHNYEFVIPSLDLNGDGLMDTQTAFAFANTSGNAAANRVEDTSSEETSTTIDLIAKITPLDPASNILVDYLGGTITAGVGAQVVVAFNQPVTLSGDNPVRAIFSTLDLEADVEAGDRTVATASARVATDDGTGAISVAPALTAVNNTNTYTYNDKNGDPQTLIVGGLNSDHEFVDLQERRVGSDIQVVAETTLLTSTNIENTIYTFTLADTSITDRQRLSLSLTARSDVTGQVQNVSLSTDAGFNGQITDFVASATAFTSTNDITLDNGDFIDDVETDAKEDANNEFAYHVNRNGKRAVDITNSDTLGTCGANECEFVIQAEPADVARGTSHGASEWVPTAYSLVSPVPFYGTVRLEAITYKEYDVNDDKISDPLVIETSQTTPTPGAIDTVYVYSNNTERAFFQNDSCAVAAPECVQGGFFYHLADPMNHDLDDKTGGALANVYGAGNVEFARGLANNSGLVYIADIAALGAAAPAGTVESLTLALDIVVNGQRFTETKVLPLN
jgi:hypothetical protein